MSSPTPQSQWEEPDSTVIAPPMARIFLDINDDLPDIRSRIFGSLQVPPVASEIHVAEIANVLRDMKLILIEQVDSSTVNLCPADAAPLHVTFLIGTRDFSIDLVVEYIVSRQNCCDSCFFALKKLILYKWLTYLHAIVYFPNSLSQQTHYFMHELLYWLHCQLSM